MKVSYPAKIEPDGESSWKVSFRDVPEALTCGATQEEAAEMAVDCLETALEFYGSDYLPRSTPAQEGEVLIEAKVPANREGDRG